jgi:putative membrane protein
MMHGWGYGFSGGWFGWLGPILMLLFWAAVIVGIVFLVRWLIARSSSSGKEETALDILRKRYARGEISGEEYRNMKEDLLGVD